MKISVSILLLSGLLALVTSELNAQRVQWAKGMGGTGTEYARALAVDKNGNSYSTGFFQGAADFDPGNGIYTMAPSGGDDLFVVKLDAAGNLVWARQAGGTADDRGYGIAVDDNGSVYTTGFFSGTVDFDPGPAVHTLVSAGRSNAFICKWDSAGNYIWAKAFGGFSSAGAALKPDLHGNIYVTGYFTGTGDFDPGAGIFQLDNSGLFSDAFIAKLDAAGNFVWAKQIGGGSYDSGAGIDVDKQGNVYVTGSFTDTVDFDPGVDVHNMVSVNGPEAFIVKMDSAGSWMWSGSGGNYGTGIAVDSAGYAYITGTFDDSTYFGGVKLVSVSTTYSDNSFITRYTRNGTVAWARALAGTSVVHAYGLALDAAANVYVTGLFADTMDLDPGSSTYQAISSGSGDLFLTKLSSDGEFRWGTRMGGEGGDNAFAVKIGSGNEIYLNGGFQEATLFNAGNISVTLNAAGRDDIFVVKIAQPPAGIPGQAFQQEVRLYPNPARGIIYLDRATALPATITVTNGAGRIIEQHVSHERHLETNLSKEPCGIYYFRIFSGQKQAVFKVLKIE